VLRGHLERGLELARAYQMPEPLSVGGCAQAMLAHVAGRLEEAERQYAEACAQMARHGSLHAEGIAALATFTIRASQHRRAVVAEHLDEAVAVARSGRPRDGRPRPASASARGRRHGRGPAG
jgi:hypothetical protein